MAVYFFKTVKMQLSFFIRRYSDTFKEKFNIMATTFFLKSCSFLQNYPVFWEYFHFEALAIRSSHITRTFLYQCKSCLAHRLPSISCSIH